MPAATRLTTRISWGDRFLTIANTGFEVLIVDCKLGKIKSSLEGNPALIGFTKKVLALESAAAYFTV